MKRALLTQLGWDASLRVEDVPTPSAPAANQVLVAVEACGVCYRDCIDRAGRMPFIQLPVTPGHEAVGRVLEVGAGVSEWKVGDRVATLLRDSCGACAACQNGEATLCQGATFVFGLLAHGGYATHLVAPERAFYAAPEELLPEHAAILMCTYGVAYRGLNRFGGVEPGMRVLVTGANGGVGNAAVQVAARLGAEVTAVVRAASHADWLSDLGANEVIVDDGQGFHKRVGSTFDVVIDCVGPPTFNSALRSARVGGKVVIVGNVVQTQVALNLGYVVVNGLHLVGSSGPTRAQMAEVIALHRARPFHLRVDRVLALDEADAAQRAVVAGGLQGRIVLRPT
jgi:D-arabinose 1-dehydrogenase-like Zn-dependent alcohol dehydrogenase